MSMEDTTPSENQKTMTHVIRLAFVATITIAGSVTIAAAAEPDCRAAFEQLDTNGDSIVEQFEFSVNKVRAVYLEAAPDGNVIPFERTDFSRRAFDEIDANRDGNLDASEISNAQIFKFTWWDRNRDGVSDWSEFYAGCGELER